MTDETKYIIMRTRPVGRDKRGNVLYEQKIQDTNIPEEEFHKEPYRGVRSFMLWSGKKLNKRLPGKDITLKVEIDD